MSLLFPDIVKTKSELDQEISSIQLQLAHLPEGKLIISHNGKNDKWYLRPLQIRSFNCHDALHK